MERFSDGLYGFAATLLVLDLVLRPPGTPQVLQAWPGYLAYIVSFLTIGGSWLLHTALTDQLARVDQLFLRLNLLLPLHPAGLAPWQCFHLRPLPQGQGSLRPRRESCAA
jgi:TMEM175 potassium channel family protein